MSLIVLKKIIEMFIILLVGVIIYKAKIIYDVSTKHLSNVLLLLVSPLLIIQSYQIDFNRELLQGLIWAFAASFLTFLFMIVASEFLCHGDRNRSSVEKIAVSYSNSGFIGIPLISGVLGDKGVFYMTAYITVFNLLLSRNRFNFSTAFSASAFFRYFANDLIVVSSGPSQSKISSSSLYVSDVISFKKISSISFFCELSSFPFSLYVIIVKVS